MIQWRSKFLIGSNHKMFKTTAETLTYLKELESLTSDLVDKGLFLFILPPYTSLPAAASEMDGRAIQLGAQNMFWEEAGQFTGEISPVFLEEMGIRLVMIGHSDRRHIFGEDDFLINKKVLSGLRHGFTVLLCVGETAQEKEFEVGPEQIRRQMKIALHSVDESQLSNLWIAYEPVWSIGKDGIPASPEYVDSMHCLIRETITELYPDHGYQVPILYGGSVNLENAAVLLRQPYTDGLFIGRTAWEAQRFAALIHDLYPVWRQKISLPTPSGDDHG